MSNLKNKKLLFLIGGIIALVIVISIIVTSLINRNYSQPSQSTSSSQSSVSGGSLSAGTFTNVTTSLSNSSNTATVDMDLSTTSLELPKVTLSSDPIDPNVSTITSIISSSSKTISNTITSTTSSVSDTQPTNIMVVNKDYKKWVVVWTTKKATIGKLKYGLSASAINKTLNDDRSIYQSKASYTHYVTITVDDASLNSGNLTFYYLLIVDGLEFSDNGKPFVYVNAPLLASPSSPTTATVSLTPKQTDGDLYVVGRVKNGSTYSDWISAVVDSSSVSLLPVGIARSTDLKSYVAITSSSTLEIKAYGKQGNLVGSKTNISLSNVDQDVISLSVNNTASQQTTIASSKKTTYTVAATTQTSSQSVVTTTDDLESSANSSISTVPKTAIEDDITLSLIGLIIFTLGISLVIFYRKTYAKSYLKSIMRDFEDQD